jgi:hypothetical protein
MITTTTFIPNVDIVIGDRQVKSHPLSHHLCLGNTAQATLNPKPTR